MISIDTRIWTNRGWKYYDDLIYGDKVISYNEDKGYNEYDRISSLRSEYREEGIIGLRFKSMHQRISRDHDFLLINTNTKELKRINAEELFFSSLRYAWLILYNRPLEPYTRSYDMEDLKWSARWAASFAQVKNFSTYPQELLDHIHDIRGLEARQWLDTFVHWNIKRAASRTWNYAVCLRNHDVRDMLFHVGPRAGVGVQWSPHRGYAFKPGGMWSIKLSSIKDVSMNRWQKTGWFRERYEGLMYNIATSNGNFLARTKKGTFLIACDKK